MAVGDARRPASAKSKNLLTSMSRNSLLSLRKGEGYGDQGEMLLMVGLRGPDRMATNGCRGIARAGEKRA
jgi:hypothetical protein